MSVEKGTVDSIEGGWAWVSTRRKDMCGHCRHHGTCQMVDGLDRMIVKARNAARARIGDEVELYVSTKTKLKGQFVLYIFPVLGLLIGAFSANSLSRLLGLNQNVGMAIFTLGGLILAFLLARFISKRMETRQELTPMVSRVLRRAVSSVPGAGVV